MKSVSVQKAARVLNGLVWIILLCNLIALYLVPAAVMQNYTLQEGIETYLSGFFHPGQDDIVAAAGAAGFLAWFWVWRGTYTTMLALFLIVSGVCTAVILWQARRVLQTILQGEPFSMQNAAALKRAAVCGFVISAAALVRVIFSVWSYHSLRPFLSYNALFVPVFAMFGLLCLVISALFRQAAEMKAEADLTI